MSNARSLAAAPALNALVPAGVYLPFGGATAPTGWLSCDGSAVSRTTYAALFTAIGTTYGAGDGSTTFNLPNMANRVPVGSGGGKTRGTTGGSATVTLSTAQLPAHNHGISDPGHGHSVYDPQHSHGQVGRYTCDSNHVHCGIGGGAAEAPSPSPGGGSGFGNTYGATTGIGINGAGTGISIQNTGSGSPVSVEQPWACCHYIIKY